MNNDIIKLLNFNPDEIEIIDVNIEKDAKYIHIRKVMRPMYCPICNTKMHSKGITKRKVNHPILQDGYKLVLLLDERRWYCQNRNCDYHKTDEFSFAMQNQRQTNIVPLLILNELKDISLPITYIAEKYNVSDTYIHNLVLRYLEPKRLPLPRILAVDEVFLEFNHYDRYAMVLMDFETGIIIDILPNRLKETYDDYFLHIPYDERRNVEFVVCDMYNPYINFTTNYFPRAKAITDSFHVHQWLNNAISKYIREVKLKYQKRDDQKKEHNNYITNSEFKTIKQSREIYLLNHFQWILLKNVNNIEYSYETKWNSKIQQYANTYDYERMFMDLDDNFVEIRRLKELFVKYNHDFPKTKETAEKDLLTLIDTYKSCNVKLFHEFAAVLKKHIDTITNSFLPTVTYIPEEESEYRYRRLSNGPLEGYNRIPKDLKRTSRGLSNFEFTRARLLWANRPDEKILASPKDEIEIHNFTNVKRGPYKKRKK